MLVSRVVGPRRSELVERPEAVPRRGELLVEVLSSGVCTGDLAPWRDHDPAGEPSVLGHEIVGRVVVSGVGPVRHGIGEVVAGLGGGGYATHAIMRDDSVVRVPPGIDPIVFMAEPLARLQEVLGRVGVLPGERVAVVGAGFMGLGLVQLARRSAPSTVVVIEPRAQARALALQLGADAAFAPDRVPPQFVERGDSVEERFDVVLEAAGTQAALDLAGAVVAPHGRLAVVAYHKPHGMHFAMDSTHRNVWHKGVSVVGGWTPDHGRIMAAVGNIASVAASGRLLLDPMVTHRFGLDEADAALALLESRPAGFVKSVLVPHTTSEPK